MIRIPATQVSLSVWRRPSLVSLDIAPLPIITSGGGIGRMKQGSLIQNNWQHRFSHGGALRKQRAGRGSRPLSTKDPLHLVLKIHREALGSGSLRSPQRMKLIHELVRTYSRRFLIKIEQISVQGDHLHLLIRTRRRSLYRHFFRVLAGQISQQWPLFLERARESHKKPATG